MVQPAYAPYTSYIAGAGLIEAASENIAIGTHVAGVVTKVHVIAGGDVRAGDPLFAIDDRDLQAELAVRRAAADAARARLERLKEAPRAEDIPPAEARVEAAAASLADLRNQLIMWEGVGDKRAVSQDEIDRKRFAVQAAEARLKEARADLDLLKAGTWAADIAVASAEVESARAQVKATETDIERLTVRAPVNGRVLKVNVRVGEYAPVGVLASPLIVMGNVDRLHVRVDIDENDAWRMKPDAKATAFVRGNRELHTPLQFVRIEPYVIPKRSLTGESTERVDTRVLQVLYGFDREALPVYVGQQMDVFIEAPPIGSAEAVTMPAADETKAQPGVKP